MEDYLQHSPRQFPCHFHTTHFETTICVKSFYSYSSVCVTSKLVSDTSAGEVAPGVILKSLEELLRATLSSKKEPTYCHHWFPKSCTLWSNLGIGTLHLNTICLAFAHPGLFDLSVWSEVIARKTRNVLYSVCWIVPWKWCDKNRAPLCSRLGLHDFAS